ncbi:MAG: hypothetical protein CMJ27_11905, partial [Phycisphaerae bacterium]
MGRPGDPTSDRWRACHRDEFTSRSFFPDRFGVRWDTLGGSLLPGVVMTRFVIPALIMGSAAPAIVMVDDVATPEASRAVVPEGFAAEVIATEPQIQDPVAFWIDPDGTLLVAETERTNHGTMDNRSSPWQLEDDLQAVTVEDRVAYLEKWKDKRANGMDFYREKEDRVRRSIDADGDGVYDASTIFAGPFNDVADGIGAGVMTIGDEVWYTNIPHLWRLVDADGDGVAEKQEAIQSGFGVRFALYGHDLHGLAGGPDGRIYWSIGDRGYHLETADGRILADPRSGAVFRCERDGSNLEVFATGLRNPQEIAFNDVGDLFTGDNTSDAGDRARIVFVAEAGETGWTMDYQSLDGDNLRGPWEQERIWEVVTDENASFRPDWTLPPIAHVGAGPSGFAHYPGLGLPDEYADHFFMCDFTGSRPNSKVWTFRPVPDGAGYRLENPRIFAKGMLNTDVAFDWNGRMLVSEWGGGWSATERGSLHAISNPESMADPRITEARNIAIEGFENRGRFELAELLGSDDQRIRGMAQQELAERRAVAAFEDVARYEARTLPRLHAIWGLGQVARIEAARNRRTAAAMDPLIALLRDPDPEVRTQAAKTLGDPAHAPAKDALVDALVDDSSRVRYHAAMSLGAIGDPEVAPYLIAMLAENDDRDRWLRHAGVVALARINARAAVEELIASPAPSLRRAAVLVMRRWADPNLERLLFDDEPTIRAEAARAIHDLPVPEAMPALASLAATHADAGVASDRTEIEVLREIRRCDSNRDGKDLATLADFDRVADSVERIRVFEGVDDGGANYLTRLESRIRAPETGDYRFAITSDDSSILRLAADADPGSLEVIARVKGWTGPNAWRQQVGQESGPIHLEAGQVVLLEARHAQGGGGNHLSVGWTRPDGTFEAPIGSSVTDLPGSVTPLLRRIVSANLRLGGAERLEALAGIASNRRLPSVVRREAMVALETFDEPGPRGRVLGWWRPVEDAPRALSTLRPTYGRFLPMLAEDELPEIRAVARSVAARVGVALDPTALYETVLSPDESSADRIACLRHFTRSGDDRIDAAIAASLKSEDPGLRAEARTQLFQRDQEAGIDSLLEATRSGTMLERQRAITGLSGIEDDRAAARIRTLATETFAEDGLASAVAVEVREAAMISGDPEVVAMAREWDARADERIEPWSIAMEGGDPVAGAFIARYHAGASCLRCHVIDGRGGDAGPSLDGLALRSDR